jgi:hypothetical protein
MPVMPAVSGDIASTALVMSALDPEKAQQMFTPANFPNDRQPQAVRRAYIEVQLQRLLAKARAGKCNEAVPGLDTLGDEDKNLGFTFNTFGSLMKAPHFQFYKGAIAFACGDQKDARKTWSKLSKPGDSIMSADDVFPYLALLNLGGADAKQRIAAAIGTLKSRLSAADPAADLIYAQGMLLVASGAREEGSALLEQSSKASNPMVQYLSLVALRDIPRK